MARGRMISKSWSTSKKRAVLYREAGALAEFCLQLFPLLVAHSDDYGRLDGDPETVKLVCDPGCPRPVSDFVLALDQFAAVGLVQRYDVDGEAWIQILKFDEHQPGLLSKRTIPKSPTPPTDTEVPGNSGPTKLNLTKPNLTKEQTLRTSSALPLPDPGVMNTPRTSPAQAVVDLWNQLVTAPIPKVTKLTADRRSKIDARLKSYPALATWRTAIAWVNSQDWCRASGKGDHPNWTATLDWLCKNDGTIQRCLERAEQPAPARSRDIGAVTRVRECPHDNPSCANPGNWQCQQRTRLEETKQAGLG